MKNKGQMFLITAAIIIVILVLLKTGINLPDILQREKELKSRFEKEFFSNVDDELVKVIDISYHQSGNITNNVFDFGNFTRKKMTERLQNFKFFYVGAITPASQGSDTMNVTVINLLNKDISASLNLNGTIKNLTTTTAVETDGDVGQFSSIAIDSNDKVHISHQNSTDTDLRYCNNTLGSWTCTNVETAGTVGSYSSIAIDSNDKVHISHHTSTAINLRYCNNTLGSWTCTNVETGGLSGYYSSIAIDSQDYVHISHYNSSGTKDIKYCNNTLGSWTCTNVETGILSTRGSSIAIDSQDYVHISYSYAVVSDIIKYCNNTLGTWDCTNVSTGLGGTGYPSIAIDSQDYVHIAYYNETGTTAASGDLVYCNNINGWTCTALEIYGISGLSSSIAIDSNDKPHISHYDVTNKALRYCYTSDFSTWDCRKVDDTGGSINTFGRAIAIKKGRLCDSTSFSSEIHMSYYNVTTEDLMYAKIDKIEDQSSWDTNFTITQGDDYTLTVDYDVNQENITIGTKANKAIYVGFFDISLTGSETTYKDKFQKNYTLPVSAVVTTSTTSTSTSTSTTIPGAEPPTP